jgi:hypothetical protein
VAPFDRGSAGASAEREYERRKRRREAGTRSTHRLIGGLLLAVREPGDLGAPLIKWS